MPPKQRCNSQIRFAFFFIHPLLIVHYLFYSVRERVGYQHLQAGLVGFSVALLLIHLGMKYLDWNSHYTLGTGFSFSVYILVSSRIAGHDFPHPAELITDFVVTLILSFLRPTVWIT